MYLSIEDKSWVIVYILHLQTQDSNNAAITNQPSPSSDGQNGVELEDVNVKDGKKESEDEYLERKGRSAECSMCKRGSCCDATAACGGYTKIVRESEGDDDQDWILECIYPKVGCKTKLKCEEDMAVVTKCTWEICSANYLLGALMCTLGLAFDTGCTYSDEEVEFEAFGTGFNTSKGYQVSFLGSKIGLADPKKIKKIDKKLKKRRKGKGKGKGRGKGKENGDEDGEEEEEEENVEEEEENEDEEAAEGSADGSADGDEDNSSAGSENEESDD